MLDRPLRVAVIGGGPSGACAAESLAKGGCEAFLIERKMDNCKVRQSCTEPAAAVCCMEQQQPAKRPVLLRSAAGAATVPLARLSIRSRAPGQRPNRCCTPPPNACHALPCPQPCGGAIPICMVEEFDLPMEIIDRRVTKMKMISPSNREARAALRFAGPVALCSAVNNSCCAARHGPVCMAGHGLR